MPESTQLTAADESSVVPEGRRAQIVAGVTDSFSAGLGIFPFGIALGLLVIQLGLPWWVAPALSLSAFAGSLELLLVGMIASTAPLASCTGMRKRNRTSVLTVREITRRGSGQFSVPPPGT